jgi:hypothetical protein
MEPQNHVLPKFSYENQIIAVVSGGTMDKYPQNLSSPAPILSPSWSIFAVTVYLTRNCQAEHADGSKRGRIIGL